MGQFKHREECPQCGSKDNLARYEDGTAHCFGSGCDYQEQNTRAKLTPKSRQKEPTIEGVFGPLIARSITQSTCERFNYQLSNYTGSVNGTRVEDVVCHVANYPNGQKLRFRDKSMKSLGTVSTTDLFGKQLFEPNPKLSIIITEGELDCLSVSQAGDNKWPVVSLPLGGGSAKKCIQANLEYLEGFRVVILFFDNDEAGQAAVQDCIDLFSVGKVKIAKMDRYKDANEALMAGEKDLINKATFNAKPYRPDGIIGIGDINFETVLKADGAGIELPFPILNDVIRGVKPGTLVLLLAGTGVGKSTFSKEIGYHLSMNMGVKVGNIFLEESLRQSILSYIAIDTNVPLWKLSENPDCIPASTLKASKDRLQNQDNLLFYDHFGSLESDNLLSKIKYLALGCECKVVILDHISIAISGQQSSKEGERKDIDILITKLRSLIEQTGVTVICVAHIKRKSGDDSKSLKLEDGRGSAALEQIPDVVIGLERVKEENCVRVKVLKNRVTGRLQNCDVLEYVPETGRLQAREGDDPC